MFAWISLNIGNLFVGTALLTIVVLVIRHLIRQHKLGPCAGCSCATSPADCSYQDLSLEELQKILEEQPFNKS